MEEAERVNTKEFPKRDPYRPFLNLGNCTLAVFEDKLVLESDECTVVITGHKSLHINPCPRLGR